MLEKHPNQIPDFKIDILGNYSSALERQTTEGVEIYNNKSDIIMNPKLDHYLPAFNRVLFTNIMPNLKKISLYCSILIFLMIFCDVVEL